MIMADMDGFSDIASGQNKDQEDLDIKVSELPEVLNKKDHLAVLDWLADYSVIASRVGDDDGVDLHVQTVLQQLEQGGYSQDYDSSHENSDVLHLISNTITRLKEGKTPIGFERILADKYVEDSDYDIDHNNEIT